MINLGFADPKFVILTEDEIFLADEIPEEILESEGVRVVNLEDYTYTTLPSLEFKPIDKVV
jgi:hypothetical protein